MGCETKSDWEDVWELGSVLPKVAKVANDIYWSGSDYAGVLSYHTHRWRWRCIFALCVLVFRSMHWWIQILQASYQYWWDPLYGKYQEKLLVAMATDANNKVFPLAFTIVDCESRSSWRWFLQCLKDTIGHVIPNEDICIISDRHLGIKNAIANWPREDNGRTPVFHRYCFRHVASNFNTHFQNLTLKLEALKVGYAT